MIFSNEFLMMEIFFQSAKKIPEQNRPKIRNISSKKDWKWFFSNFLKIIISRIMTDSELDRQIFRKLSSRCRIRKSSDLDEKEKNRGSSRWSQDTSLPFSLSLSLIPLSLHALRETEKSLRKWERESFDVRKKELCKKWNQVTSFRCICSKKLKPFDNFCWEIIFLWLEFRGDKFFIPIIEILNCCLLDLFSFQVLVISLLSQ